MTVAISKEHELLNKMNRLLAALNEHVDAHPTCCLKNVLRSYMETGFE